MMSHEEIERKLDEIEQKNLRKVQAKGFAGVDIEPFDSSGQHAHKTLSDYQRQLEGKRKRKKRI